MNFAEAWLNRVREKFFSTDQAPWLNGVEEIDTKVIEFDNSGIGESNTIHVPTTTFAPEVLLNNTTYPLALQDYTDDGMIINLDKYQTKPTSISDDKLIGASYPIIDAATRPHVREINRKKYAKAIHALAPSSNTANTPIITATGEDDGTGRLRLRYEDLVMAKGKLDAMEAPSEGRRIVLSSEHFNDLLLDRKYFGNLLVDYNKGTTAPIIAGFEIYQYNANPLFTSAGDKKAFGAISASGDRKASVFFLVENVVKKTGITKQYFTPATLNGTIQANTLNYRHYFICVPVLQQYFGAIY